MLRAINLSLSSACGADCLFCPSNRGERIAQKVMPFGLVKRIVDEVSSNDFKKRHRIESISIGENGDAFLNADMIEILRYIKSRSPEVKTRLYNSFQNFTEDKAQVILSERLIDDFVCNIDGSDEGTYLLYKKMDLKNVTKNLLNFLETRRRLKNESALRIFILTMHRYIKTIHKHFGFYPIKLKDIGLRNIPDDFSIIKKRWKKVLDRRRDEIYRMGIVGWAERQQAIHQAIDYRRYSCPHLSSVRHCAFIAPDGIWYGCCLDSNNELILGNVMTEDIDRIYLSKAREDFIKHLEKKGFAKISGPCRTVNCCQYIFYWGALEKFIIYAYTKIKRVIPQIFLRNI